MELVVKIDLRFESSQMFDEVANMPLQHLPQKSEAIIRTHSNICEELSLFFLIIPLSFQHRGIIEVIYILPPLFQLKEIFGFQTTLAPFVESIKSEDLKKNLQCGQLLLFLSTSQINQPDVKIVKSCKSDHLNYFLMSLSLLYQVSK